MACEHIDATTVSTEPLIVIPFGLRLSSQDAAQAVQQRCSQAWDDGLMEVVNTFGLKACWVHVVYLPNQASVHMPIDLRQRSHPGCAAVHSSVAGARMAAPFNLDRSVSCLAPM